MAKGAIQAKKKKARSDSKKLRDFRLFGESKPKVGRGSKNSQKKPQK